MSNPHPINPTLPQLCYYCHRSVKNREPWLLLDPKRHHVGYVCGACQEEGKPLNLKDTPA